MSDNTSPSEDGTYKRVRRPWLVQASVGLGVVIITLDTGAINVSLHTLARHFGVDAGTVAWLPLLAFLIVTSTLLPFGKLADLIGNKIVFAGGFAVYATGSLLSGLAPSFPLLLAFRSLQAVGVSMLSANSTAILTECFPPGKRGMALGVNSAIVGLGFFVGPIIAGFIIMAIGWRFIFFTTVPLCLAALALAMLVLPSSTRVRNRRFDFLGALLFALAAICLLLAINAARTSSLYSPPVLALAGGFVLSAIAFVVVERRVSEPMVDLRLFRIRLFSLSLASAFLIFVGIAGQDLLVPLFVQQVMLQSPATAGLAISIVPFIRMFVSPPSGMLSDRIGSRWLTGLGAVLATFGLFGLSQMNAETTLHWLVLYLALVGLGTGIYFSPNMHATMTSVPPANLGVAAGALALRRNMGQSLGVALAAYLLHAGAAGPASEVSGFQLAFQVGTVSVALGALTAIAAGSTLTARRRAAKPGVAR